MKNKDIFKKLVGLEGGNKKWQVATSKTVDSEKWIYHILPADAEAPSIEDDRKPKIFLIVFAVTMLAFLLLAGRLFAMQVFSGNKNLKLAENNRVREEVIRSPRGIIYDSNGTALVKNVPYFDVTVIPGDLPRDTGNRSEVLKKLASITGVSINDIDSRVNSKENIYSTQPVLIAKNVDKDKSMEIESKMSGVPAVKVEVNPIREYLDNGLLSHVLGYVGRISADELKDNNDYSQNDYIGKTGLENSYERILRGVAGATKTEVDSLGKPEKVLGTTDPIPGDNLKLSIDFELQKVLAASLQKEMDKAKVKKATAVAINPQNGQIMAMVDLPTYDNNLFAKGISTSDYNKLMEDSNNPLLFRAVSGEYPSGSVIKPFIASAALEEGTITEDTTVLSNGGITVGGFTFPDWKAGGHGVTNVLKALAESVNTFFYAIAGGYQNIKGLGPDKIKEYLDKFGFDNYTGVDVNGEAKGSIPNPEWKERVLGQPWYLGDTYHMGIGQGDLLVTPLQIAVGTTAIANGGTLYEPHIVQSILDGNGNVKDTTKPVIKNKQVVSAKTIDIVRRGMRQTITAGSARSLNSLAQPIAGKTGTAQFGANNEHSHAWFTSFGPFDNPTIELTILVEGAGGGDVYAVPVAQDVYSWYFANRK